MLLERVRGGEPRVDEPAAQLAEAADRLRRAGRHAADRQGARRHAAGH